MAITRRQFVTRLGALAAAMGMSQTDLSKVVEAFAHGATSAWPGAWTDKPKVVWVHGAECTGCSTSLLSLFEDVRAKAIENANYTILGALDYAVGGDGDGTSVLNADAGAGHPFGHRTLANSDSHATYPTGSFFEESAYVATIADVLIDFIDLQYHETVMGMGGDMAYQWLHDMLVNPAASAPFVLVVEGAVQPADKGGYWGETGATPWCSIGMGESAGELAFDEVVAGLSSSSKCAAVIPIGQCACFGGYPACSSPVLSQDATGKVNGGNMTGAMGVHDFLLDYAAAGVADKVVNVPGCPTNPWWFVLTVVAWLVDFQTAGADADGALGILHRGAGGALDISINASAVDRARRLKAVYGIPLHGPYCKRYQSALNGIFATKPGEPGCLQLIGCKGPSVGTLCGPHGWNGQNPRNGAQDASLDYGVASVNGNKGGNCVAGGAPCMACTEPGYPDAFLPFVVR